jgi:hypothetical protein
MRRGKLNKTSYLLIIISAIFTVTSYVSDQLVIRYENNLRTKNFNYQNLDTKIRSLEAIVSSFESLDVQTMTVISNELLQRNFWIKNLFIMESNKSYFKDIRKDLEVFIDHSFSVDNIKWRARKSTWDLIDSHVSIKDSYKLIFNQKIFDEIKFFSSEEFNNTLGGYNMFEENQDKFLIVKSFDDVTDMILNKDLDDVKLNLWWDLRNFRLLLVETLHQTTLKLEPVIKYIEKDIENKTLDLDIIFYERKKINAYKNYFILLGIISQILTLVFLLLLFRSLIKQKIF